MIKHGDYRIRLLEKEDLPFITKVRTSPHVQDNVGQVIFVNEELQAKWFENLLADKSKLYTIFEFGREPIGYIRLTDIDHINKSICIGGDIAEQYCGQGHGKAMYSLIFQLGFQTWNMNRLWLLVLEDNKRAQRLYEKVGLQKEGVQRKAVYKNGKYQDYIMMSILREEYDNDTLV